jgi:hypothetical protein
MEKADRESSKSFFSSGGEIAGPASVPAWISTSFFIVGDRMISRESERITLYLN